MKKTLTALGVATAVVGMALPLSGHALEFTGYMRSGVGESVNSDSQSCFQLPGAPSKYSAGGRG